MEKLHKLLLIGKFRRKLLIITIFWVFVIRILLNILSFKKLLKLVNSISKNNKQLRKDESILQDIIWSINTVDKHLVGKRSCLIKSLAANIILRKYGFSVDLQIGVKRDGSGNFMAHAWIEYDGKSIFKEGEEIEFKKFSFFYER